ncbi:Per1-like protein [Suillus tomentosus]|nr:Per1-like protein [Suillus tomentosus]
MHMLTGIAIRESSKIHQYHGKWLFWWLFGMQEPASVAFSLWNMYYHIQGWRQLRSKIPMSVNAWFWFAVFHTRDCPTVLRLFNQYPTHSREDGHIQRTPVHVLWSSVCTVAYLSHVTYLSILPRFDYSYNILTSLLASRIICLSLPLIRRFPFKSKTYRPSYTSEVAVFVVLTTAATTLELFDFPPWGRIIEGSCLFWYDFLIKDSLVDGWTEPKR